MMSDGAEVAAKGGGRMGELLKPCPFCGSVWTQVRWIGWDSPPSAYETGYRGECTDCFAMSRAFRTEAEAAEAWNRRVT